MKFDFCIGNPPYMEPAPGSSTSDKPVYNYFMDEAFEIADKVEMITPGRFLFNAGATPNAWNEKMLNDKHFKVEKYENDSSKVFPSIQLPGGVAITYRDAKQEFGAIGIYTIFPELNTIKSKVREIKEKSLNSIMYPQNKFNLTSLYADFPDLKKKIGSDGTDKRFRNNIFDYVTAFKNVGGENMLKVLGLEDRERVYKYIDLKYVETVDWIFKYKVFLPFANGASGTLGNESARMISSPVIATPGEGFTQTFIGVGKFNSYSEAEHLYKYILSKFARALLGILKATQSNKPETWNFVPLQDFTDKSDINWNTTIANIDKQLYKKYGLSKEEIDFIESHVKEMV